MQKVIKQIFSIGLVSLSLSTAVWAQSANTALFPAGMARDCQVYDAASCTQIIYTENFSPVDFEAALPKYMSATPARKMLVFSVDSAADKTRRAKLQADMLEYAKTLQTKLQSTKTKLIAQLNGPIPESMQASFIDAANQNMGFDLETTAWHQLSPKAQKALADDQAMFTLTNPNKTQVIVLNPQRQQILVGSHAQFVKAQGNPVKFAAYPHVRVNVFNNAEDEIKLINAAVGKP